MKNGNIAQQPFVTISVIDGVSTYNILDARLFNEPSEDMLEALPSKLAAIIRMPSFQRYVRNYAMGKIEAGKAKRIWNCR